MNDRQHSVLSLFYDEGHSEITPSFLAYRMRMSTGDASALLDEMVTQDTLELHVDDEGHLIYSLPDSEAGRIGQGQRPAGYAQAAPQPQGQPSPPQGQPSPQGAPRQRSSPQQPAQPPPQQAQWGQPQHAPDGTDGSVASPYPSGGQPSSGGHRPPAPQQGPRRQPQRGYDPQANPHHPGQHNQPQQPAPGQRPQPGQRSRLPRAPQDQRPMPDNQALTPYQSQNQTPLRANRYEPSDGRVPVLAGALSLLVPGLGQFYNGEIGKGVMLLFSCLLLSIFLLFWVVWIWSIIDAYMVAERSNQKKLTDQSPPQRPMLPHHQGRSNHNAA